MSKAAALVLLFFVGLVMALGFSYLAKTKSSLASPFAVLIFITTITAFGAVFFIAVRWILH